MHPQHADGLLITKNWQSDVRHGFLRQGRACHSARQIAVFLVDVLHDHDLATLHDTPGHPLTQRITTPLDFLTREPIGVANGQVAAGAVGQHDTATVQSKQLGQQVQHLANGWLRLETARQQLDALAHQQGFVLCELFFLVGLDVGHGGQAGHWFDSHSANSHRATPKSVAEKPA